MESLNVAAQKHMANPPFEVWEQEAKLTPKARAAHVKRIENCLVALIKFDQVILEVPPPEN